MEFCLLTSNIAIEPPRNILILRPLYENSFWFLEIFRLKNFTSMVCFFPIHFAEYSVGCACSLFLRNYLKFFYLQFPPLHFLCSLLAKFLKVRCGTSWVASLIFIFQSFSKISLSFLFYLLSYFLNLLFCWSFHFCSNNFHFKDTPFVFWVFLL